MGGGCSALFLVDISLVVSTAAAFSKHETVFLFFFFFFLGPFSSFWILFQQCVNHQAYEYIYIRFSSVMCILFRHRNAYIYI